jgi:hypothetical protein
MKKLVLGAAAAGVALVGLRAAARHCRTMLAQHCDSPCGHSQQCA